MVVSACKVDGICVGHSHWTATYTIANCQDLILKLEIRSWDIWNKFFDGIAPIK